MIPFYAYFFDSWPHVHVQYMQAFPNCHVPNVHCTLYTISVSASMKVLAALFKNIYLYWIEMELGSFSLRAVGIYCVPVKWHCYTSTNTRLIGSLHSSNLKNVSTLLRADIPLDTVTSRGHFERITAIDCSSGPCSPDWCRLAAVQFHHLEMWDATFN